MPVLPRAGLISRYYDEQRTLRLVLYVQDRGPNATQDMHFCETTVQPVRIKISSVFLSLGSSLGQMAASWTASPR